MSSVKAANGAGGNGIGVKYAGPSGCGREKKVQILAIRVFPALSSSHPRPAARATMAPPVRTSISTYRLRKDRLEDYLKSQFSDYPKEYFNVHVSSAGQRPECFVHRVQSCVTE